MNRLSLEPTGITVLIKGKGRFSNQPQAQIDLEFLQRGLMGVLWLTQTPLAGLRKQEKQKLHLGNNASESSHHVTCQSQCSLEIVTWSSKHVLDRSTHEILAQKYLTDFFQHFKATLSREWKNRTGCPTFLVLLENMQPRAAFVTVSHTKVQSNFPGLSSLLLHLQGRSGLRDEDKAQLREAGSDTGASPHLHT